MSKRKGFKLFISCEEAVNTCDRTQYGETSLWEKIKHTIHLFYCKTCQNYSANNKKLTELVNKPEVDCLENKEKTKIKDAFEQELKNYQ